MIQYNHGWGVFFVFRISGSVFPKAIVWALPAGALAAVMNIMKHSWGYESTTNGGTVMVSFASFISTLGFMVVFRSNQAWGRYWEGAGMVQKFRGAWFNAASSLIAFCSKKPEDKEKVRTFQCAVIRLMSFLYGTALSTLADTEFDCISQEGISLEHVEFLDRAAPEPNVVKCEVIMQWLQRTIVENISNGVLPIAPPILSRVFNDLSSGVANVSAARKINELPFPFHYAQMLSVMLMVYTFGVPCAAGYVMDSWWGAAGSTFFNVFVLWAVNYLAVEIEQPFGSGLNDLPLKEEMNRMNHLLRMLLDDCAQTPPKYKSTGGMRTSMASCGNNTSLLMVLQRTSCCDPRGSKNLVPIATEMTEPAPPPFIPMTAPSPPAVAEKAVFPIAELPDTKAINSKIEDLETTVEVLLRDVEGLKAELAEVKAAPRPPLLASVGGGDDEQIGAPRRATQGVASEAPAAASATAAAAAAAPRQPWRQSGLGGRHPHAVEDATYDDELEEEIAATPTKNALGGGSASRTSRARTRAAQGLNNKEWVSHRRGHSQEGELGQRRSCDRLGKVSLSAIDDQ
eukprot:CAMPEP_0115515686 /NCGR_PEP_ID=MMETSP0271-20121206/76359_1 /TAXON_ID=71861 /ORGANISM="Scrippsiella trochoidea, Strain CCMP3099" /LENGTH=569 /DNA_ID=CAMNT_0002946295 /DNA_START=1 /DNA_END=1712 /DNA_ORIENTATION=+